jgi:predicted amidohydrolase YtcJ
MTTTLPISSIVPSDSNLVLQHYIRTKEINDCVKTTSLPPNQCACHLSGNVYVNECIDGYNAAQTLNSNRSISWCVDHVPSSYKDDMKVEQYDA